MGLPLSFDIAPDVPRRTTRNPTPPRKRHRVVLIDTGRNPKNRTECSLCSHVEDNGSRFRTHNAEPSSMLPREATRRHRHAKFNYIPLSFYGMARSPPTWWSSPVQICVPNMVGRFDPSQRGRGLCDGFATTLSVKVSWDDDDDVLKTHHDFCESWRVNRDLPLSAGLGSDAENGAQRFVMKTEVSLQPSGRTQAGQHYGGIKGEPTYSIAPTFAAATNLAQQTQRTETNRSQRSKRASPAHGTSTVSWVFTMSNNAYSSQTHSPCLPSDEQGEWVWVPKTAMPSPQAGHLDYQHATTPLFTSGFEDSSASPTTFSANPWDSLMMTGQVDNTLFTSPSSSMINEFGTPFTGSPADALLEDFFSDGHVGGSDLFSDVSLPQQDFISTDLLNPYVDGTLFPAIDLTLNIDTFVPEVATPFTPFGVALSPASSVHESPAFSYSPPIFESSLPATSSASPDALPPSAPQLHSCSESTCSKTFDKMSDLKRHERKHRQPFRCELCGKGHLDKRALGRHLWAKHPEYAQQHNTRSERIKCTECDYEGRADNVARHMKRHAKKR
ncbi:hypothetical protein B0T21DRAFT_432417 [Apiosordaria backusii]|uniref:C2H2-type domain-containing protein n=1 Tax=Apiosordaria backusii TaxID=314023 RepID=A0AA39ZQ63_9PEZI|nr:hypothetical protein B0T21DRAFT_432417 [Apiosordaria backusii]